jgi:hypothetical protein
LASPRLLSLAPDHTTSPEPYPRCDCDTEATADHSFRPHAVLRYRSFLQPPICQAAPSLAIATSPPGYAGPGPRPLRRGGTRVAQRLQSVFVPVVRGTTHSPQRPRSVPQVPMARCVSSPARPHSRTPRWAHSALQQYLAAVHLLHEGLTRPP